MHLRLEQIDPARNRWRWYALSVQPTLFGEWTFTREWGGWAITVDRPARSSMQASARRSVSAFETLRAVKARRGYRTTPQQLDLPLWG